MAKLERRHPQVIDLGLQRCGEVYKRLGSPRPAKKVFTVAGTNGKGSTVAYLAAMSINFGQRCGTYTSPHILSFNERISIMGEPVSDECLVTAFAEIEKVRAATSLTYFEFTTLAAFLILQQAELDTAVLEVGLGGRLDAVNLVDTNCAVITPIGLDHQDYLGTDIATIAVEKAGIIRPQTPVVCTEAKPSKAILTIAHKLEAPLYKRLTDFDIRAVSDSGSDQLSFSMGSVALELPPLPLAGRHQIDNLAAATAAFLLLNTRANAEIENCLKSTILSGLPGRLQRIADAPEILIDVGHNGLAAKAIAALFLERDKTNVVCVLAMLADKPAEAVVAALQAVCHRWVCVDSQGSRGQSADVLAQRIKLQLPAADVIAFDSFDVAIGAAIIQAGNEGSVLVFGSFSVVAEALSWLQNSHSG